MYLCLKQDFALTHDIAMIQPSFTSSKQNMGEMFGLKFHLSYLCIPQRFFWNASLWKEGHLIYCICNFVEKPSLHIQALLRLRGSLTTRFSK